ncbi:exosortase A [Ideonella sp. DXS22W]|uniref:Exosortase A n=1 Tax=Pseudaquabacterium inlustre TaxID=2984192 RepID=A0ABU9CRS6_9BURK
MNTDPTGMPRIPAAWRLPAVALVAYVLVVLLAYRDTATAMVAIWSRSETYTHAFVVPPIALWLIWRQRAALVKLQPKPQPWALLPMMLVAALWWVADRVAVNAGTHFALVGLLVLGVPALLGWTVTRRILFPLGFLFFSVPFGEFLTPIMMQYTADFTVAALRLTGIPVYREGQQFIIPTGHWSVVEACSGVRYLVASFMVGTLFAYLNYCSVWRRIVFMAVSLAVPVIANWLRAYMIVMLGHLSNNAIATGVDHIVYGWVFFGVVITLMFFVGARWAEPPRSETTEQVASSRPWETVPVGWVVAIGALATMAMGWPHVATRAPASAVRAAPVWQWPAAMSVNWSRQDIDAVRWRPSFRGASGEWAAAYRAGAANVTVDIFYYRDLSPDRKLVSSVNTLGEGHGADWNVVSRSVHQIDGPDVPARWGSADIAASAGMGASLTGGRARLKVRQIYWVGGHWTESDAHAKLWQAWAEIRRLPDDAAAVFISTPDAGDGAADRALDAFIVANFAQLQQLLLQARGH